VASDPTAQAEPQQLAAPAEEPLRAGADGGATASAPAAQPVPPPVGRPCAACGAPLAPGQDWCLQCGAGAPGSLRESGAWRSGAGAIAAAAVLALGAGAAAYAALNKGHRAGHVVTRTIAQVPAAATAPGSVAPPATATPTPPRPLGTPTTLKAPPTTPGKAFKLPKIAAPNFAKAPITTPTTSVRSSTPAPSTGGGALPPAASGPAAIVLDTNAASTYNPYAAPAAGFGDPSLAIDGETSTAWTAQVDPAVAPRMAAGLVVDLKSARRLSALTLITSTPGMTVQIYGATGRTAPATITDPGWTKLGPALVEHKRKLRLTLHDSSHAFRFVVLWISHVPAASVGSAAAPGHVSVNELELFPAR
jgi:hypothetical protein